MDDARQNPRVPWLGITLAVAAVLWLAACAQQAGPTRAPDEGSRTSVWMAPGVPAFVRRTVSESIAGHPRQLVAARSGGQADVRLRVVARPASRRHEGGRHLAEVVLVPVVPFPTIADDVSWSAIRRFWGGDGEVLSRVTGDGSRPTLYLTATTRAALEGLLGGPPAPSAPVRNVAAGRLLETTWRARGGAWSIVPFDGLRPRWKALTVDGRSVLDRGLDTGRYPLVAKVAAEGPDDQVARLRRAIPRGPKLTNRDTGRMTILMMTGVTALSRNIAAKMESNGVRYPGAKIRDVLLDNDLLHISNEVSFTDDCPYPGPGGTRFCSAPKYVDLLRDVGTDIVELSGNHNLDWGPEPARRTLDMYEKRGWKTFAGGRDHIQAHRPLTMTRNGNKLAFLGCNPVGASYAWADRDRPGSATCDDAAMRRQIRDLRARGYLPIVTFQHWETYQYSPTAQQIEDFGAMSRAGAAIVSGSQAHHPQGFAFDRGRFIHYGLGNLFFDQMQTLGTRQEMVDKHVFYKGRHLSTQLSTFLLEDYSQPRPMTPAERGQLLASVFEASEW